MTWGYRRAPLAEMTGIDSLRRFDSCFGRSDDARNDYIARILDRRSGTHRDQTPSSGSPGPPSPGAGER